MSRSLACVHADCGDCDLPGTCDCPCHDGPEHVVTDPRCVHSPAGAPIYTGAPVCPVCRPSLTVVNETTRPVVQPWSDPTRDVASDVEATMTDLLEPPAKQDANEALARVCGFACYPDRDAHHWMCRVLNAELRAIRAASSVTNKHVIRVPRIPFPGGTSQAEFWRTAARNIERGYPVGGSNMTAAVVALLLATSDAVE